MKPNETVELAKKIVNALSTLSVEEQNCLRDHFSGLAKREGHFNPLALSRGAVFAALADLCEQAWVPVPSTPTTKVAFKATFYPTPNSRGRTITGPTGASLEEAARGFREKIVKMGLRSEPAFVVRVVNVATKVETTYNDPEKDKDVLDILRTARFRIGLDG